MGEVQEQAGSKIVHKPHGTIFSVLLCHNQSKSCECLTTHTLLTEPHYKTPNVQAKVGKEKKKKKFSTGSNPVIPKRYCVGGLAELSFHLMTWFTLNSLILPIQHMGSLVHVAGCTRRQPHLTVATAARAALRGE